MKIIFLTNNDITTHLIDWLKNESKEELIVMNRKITTTDILSYKPDFLVSYNYRYIIKEDVLNLLQNRAINLHISLLPWNRGAHPNVWSFLEDTPKGVTIHIIDKGLDTGDIILQKEVYLDENKETLMSSYTKLHKEIQNLLISNWEEIKNNRVTPEKHPEGGSIHYIKDFEQVKPLLSDKGWEIKIKELKERYKNLILNGDV